ncbi:hypothetical protein BCR42DRAFT_418684 [Absidia repens]|uniref:Uncharacterized protein n=1 Tax=Absidia repens TaxID=90262 RepID=A0A1X2IBW8_9FUNG|nr:hypothetical protein BCR42DRAFT_418684 [Absidia repens]
MNENDDSSMRSVDSLSNDNHENVATAEEHKPSPRPSVSSNSSSSRLSLQPQLVEQSQREREEAAEQERRVMDLERTHHQLTHDLQAKRNEYQRMESNFYAHMAAIRATDDDLSTIRPELGHVFSQVSNLCMSLRSKMDRDAGHDFVLAQWPNDEWIRRQWLHSDTDDNNNDVENSLRTPSSQQLEPAIITLFIETHVARILIERILKQPIHLGASINAAFAELDTWMTARDKKPWAIRLRQQLAALIAKSPQDDETDAIRTAQQALVDDLVATLEPLYPSMQRPTVEKKLLTLVQRTCRLATAIHGQDIDIHTLPIQEGAASFDPDLMHPVNKGKPEGTVFLVITPPFVVSGDDDLAFVVPAKVLCL